MNESKIICVQSTNVTVKVKLGLWNLNKIVQTITLSNSVAMKNWDKASGP